MNVLITGHTGFIGGTATRYFIKQGHVVYGVSRSIAAESPCHQYSMNITDFPKLSKLVKEKSIDIVVHFAGKPIISDCDKDPFNAFNANGLGTASVLESSRLAGVKKTIVVETDKVYGFQEQVPTTEDAVPNPKSPYELSKVLAATFCDFYRTQYSMNVISVRPVNVFGPGDYSYSRILPVSMRNISEGKGIPVYKHAIKMYRDYIYVNDVAKMMYLLATTKTKYQIYNFSTNSPMSTLDFAKRVTAVLNHPIDPIIVESLQKFSEIPYQAIDGSRFTTEFDFIYTSFEKAVKETYEAYCEKFNISILGR